MRCSRPARWGAPSPRTWWPGDIAFALPVAPLETAAVLREEMALAVTHWQELADAAR